MLKNYFLIAWRHLAKSRVYAFINIVGLAVGMAATILILLFVQFELSFDSFHEKADRTYRISRKWTNVNDGEVNLHLGAVAPVVAPLLEADYSEDIEATCRISPSYNFLFTFDEDRQYVEEEILFAEPSFFSVFSFPLLQGDPEKALSGPGKVILSETAARKYFTDLNEAVGQEFIVDNQFPMVVSGIIADAPKNSHFHFDIIASFDTYVAYIGGPQVLEDNWAWNRYYTYVTVKEGVTQERMQSLMPEFIDRNLTAAAQRQGRTINENNPPSMSNFLIWWPIEDIHLYSNLDSELEANSSISLVYTYSAIAILILVIACINFMNLSTARASKREKEVGLRKVFGANKKLLIRQFLVEAIVMSLIALVISIFIVELALPFFNSMVNRNLSIDYTSTLTYYVQLLGVALGVGLVSGSYPALFLSKFQPAAILRGVNSQKGKGLSLRSILVVGQFTAAVCLLICMGVVYQQFNFLQDRDLAFNDQGVLMLNDWYIENDFENIITDLERSPAIEQVALSNIMPSERLLDSHSGKYEINGDMKTLDFRIADVMVSFNFLDAYGVELVAGRTFNPDIATDSTEAFVVNEETITTMGFSSAEDALGTPMEYGGRKGSIVGVVRDFHFENAKFPITPVLFYINDDRSQRISVRVAVGQEQEALSWLQERYAFYNPGYPLVAEWVTDNYKQQYAEEDRLGRAFGFFALLAVIIGMLGLFGLALHATQIRIREIGVRKVLGASNSQVVMLLSSSFSKLVGIAFVIGAPTAYYLMNQWLSTNFPYHTHISWTTILLSGLTVLLVALITVASQALKAAVSNPTRSLRQD